MSNCLLFAVRLWWRRGRRGYIVVRRSRFGAFPHFLYAEMRRSGSLRVVAYRPVSPVPRRCPPPLFRGVSQWGDL